VLMSNDLCFFRGGSLSFGASYGNAHALPAIEDGGANGW
jgi:hypothetical protein